MNFETSFKIMAKSIIEKPIRSPEYPPISATMLERRKYDSYKHFHFYFNVSSSRSPGLPLRYPSVQFTHGAASLGASTAASPIPACPSPVSSILSGSSRYKSRKSRQNIEWKSNFFFKWF